MLHGRGNIVEIAGLTGSTSAMDRHQGFVSAISPYPGINFWLVKMPVGYVRKREKDGHSFEAFSGNRCGVCPE